MKNLIILLFCIVDVAYGMEVSDANNNKKEVVLFNTSDQRVEIDKLLVPKSFSDKHAYRNSNQRVIFPFSSRTFKKLSFLLENEESENKKLTNFELHQALYSLFTTRYNTESLKDLRELIEASLFLKVSRHILEVCVHSYVVKSKGRSKDKRTGIENKFSDLKDLFHKWIFLCVDSAYVPEHDDFTVSWQELQFFYGTSYLDQKFYPRALLREDAYISLAGFHLGDTISLKETLKEKGIVWNKVQRVDLRCNQFQELSFLKKIKPSVQVLVLSNNMFATFDIRNFSQLTRLELNNNQLTAIPVLAGCLALQKIWLTNNQIEEIKEFDLLDQPHLEELQLSNNEITTIHPESFTNCSALKLIDLSYNPLTKLEFNLPKQCMLSIQR